MQKTQSGLEIEGYIYSGDHGSVANYGGKWIGINRNNLGHVIEVLGMTDLEDGDEKGAIILSSQLFVRGHVEMRHAIESCGWDILNIEDRDQRRGMMLDAYHGYYGADPIADFGGEFSERITTDDEAIGQANKWAQ